MKIETRSYTNYCKIKNIPTVYVPHSGIPIYDEIICKSDFKYITVGGKNAVDYFVKKGEPKKNNSNWNSTV